MRTPPLAPCLKLAFNGYIANLTKLSQTALLLSPIHNILENEISQVPQEIDYLGFLPKASWGKVSSPCYIVSMHYEEVSSRVDKN